MFSIRDQHFAYFNFLSQYSDLNRPPSYGLRIKYRLLQPLPVYKLITEGASRNPLTFLNVLANLPIMLENNNGNSERIFGTLRKSSAKFGNLRKYSSGIRKSSEELRLSSEVFAKCLTKAIIWDMSLSYAVLHLITRTPNVARDNMHLVSQVLETKLSFVPQLLKGLPHPLVSTHPEQNQLQFSTTVSFYQGCNFKLKIQGQELTWCINTEAQVSMTPNSIYKVSYRRCQNQTEKLAGRRCS